MAAVKCVCKTSYSVLDPKKEGLPVVEKAVCEARGVSHFKSVEPTSMYVPQTGSDGNIQETESVNHMTEFSEVVAFSVATKVCDEEIEAVIML